ncbi:MAG: molybdopterin-binding protein [Methylocystaceae bacterium]
MQTIRVEDAVGTVLCHDITKIVPGEFKGAAFPKGHVITREDIPKLLKLGKEHVYVWKLEPGMVHENDAAIRIAGAVAGSGLVTTEPREGKVSLLAAVDGLCVVNEDLLLRVNMIDQVVVATRNNRKPVKAGDAVAGIRVVPLVIDEQTVEAVEALGSAPGIIQVKSLSSRRVGVVIVGNEIFRGRIEDQFGPVIKAKAESYGCQVIQQIIVPDDINQIKQAIQTLTAAGADMVLATGGMSVDPDDVTPQALRETGARVVTYGAPVLPGAMLMVAYLGEVPVLGLPGCVMYSQITAFDLVLPIILSGTMIDRAMIARLGMGGLCLNCPVCHYPACSFGTGA